MVQDIYCEFCETNFNSRRCLLVDALAMIEAEQVAATLDRATASPQERADVQERWFDASNRFDGPISSARQVVATHPRLPMTDAEFNDGLTALFDRAQDRMHDSGLHNTTEFYRGG